MSHYAVLVIGENIEEQLAPFDENLRVEEYVRDIVSQKEKDGFIEYYTDKLKTGEHAIGRNQPRPTSFVIADEYAVLTIKDGILYGSFESLYRKFGEQWNGSSWRKDSDGTWQEWTSYNPNSRWDWYQIGGRWAGYLRVREGVDPLVPNFSWGYTNEEKLKVLAEPLADQALKGQVDFDYMRREARGKAEREYALFEKYFDVTQVPAHRSWRSILADHPNDGREVWTQLHDAQPLVQRWAELKALHGADESHELQALFARFFTSVDDYAKPRDQYIEEDELGAVVPYAILYQGEWLTQGRMGWFGCSHDEMTDLEWRRKGWAIIESLEDDELLTIVDCHI